jgi:hypothetical protein
LWLGDDGLLHALYTNALQCFGVFQAFICGPMLELFIGCEDMHSGISVGQHLDTQLGILANSALEEVGLALQ